MPNIEWNAEEYQKNFSFVPDYGEAVTELITKPRGSLVAKRRADGKVERKRFRRFGRG